MNDAHTYHSESLGSNTKFSRLEGYTTIDTPTDEDLYCEFEVDDEGHVSLTFTDRTTANQIAEMVLGGAFSGFEVKPKPVQRRS